MKRSKTKKLVAATLALGMISTNPLCFSNVQNVSAAALKGDFNGNDVVDSTDASYLKEFINSSQPSPKKTISDLTGDNKIDCFDMVEFRKCMNKRFTASSPVKINEVCSTNQNGIVDSYGKHADWIELYNTSGSAVSLKGYGLSDGEKNIGKFTFPDVTIPAYGYLVVYATKDYESNGNEIHAPFNISKDGESIVLSDQSGNILDLVNVPALDTDTTYGRYSDGSASLNVLKPTPKEKNQLGEAVKSNLPIFSKESGFYSSEFSLSIVADSGSKIYYTTDGSVPTTASTLFTGSLNIRNRTNDENVVSAYPNITFNGNNAPTEQVTKGTVVKAIAVDSTGKASDVVTKTYFVGIDQASQYNSLPIISISMDNEDLFDYDKGIYVTGKCYDDYLKNGGSAMQQEWLKEANFSQKGKEWERPCHVDFFEGDGTLGFEQNLGIRIQGNASRTNAQKSFKFHADKDYGKSKLEYNLIPGVKNSEGKKQKEYKSFIIRNGANDINATKFRDPLIQDLVSDRNFETQSGRPVIAFINGEYWGVYQLQEDYSDNYIEEIYGYDKDEVIMIKNCKDVEEGVDSDIQYFNQLVDFVKQNDMSSDANYKKFCEMVDVQSLCDYVATEVYINNQDLFSTSINNMRMWRTRSVIDNGKGDGRWRWMLYDTEYSTDVYGSSFNNNTDAINGSLNESLTTVFFAKTFKQNAEFRNLYLNTVMDIANVNFNYDRVKTYIDKYNSLYAPVMPENNTRFPSSSGSGWNIPGMGDWGQGGWPQQGADPQQGGWGQGGWPQQGADPQQGGQFDWNNMGNWGGQGGNIGDQSNEPVVRSAPGDNSNLASQYQQKVQSLDNFFRNRFNTFVQAIQRSYSTGATQQITLSTNSSNLGSIKINTATPDLSKGSWTGTYFADIPVTLTAVPKDGATFKGWGGDVNSTSTTITVTLDKATTITAQFS